MVKKIDDHIKKAFATYGFSEEEVRNGCWLLEKGGKHIAWIAYHKFLERVATSAGIVFNEPTVLEVTPQTYRKTTRGKEVIKQTRDVAILVCGCLKEGGTSAWAIGEANINNNDNDYPWAMAEKRAKDRVILKLLGIAGDMYSEEEAEDFKDKSKFFKEVPDSLGDAAQDEMTQAFNEQDAIYDQIVAYISNRGSIEELEKACTEKRELVKQINVNLQKKLATLKEKEMTRILEADNTAKLQIIGNGDKK